jgi:hypothetical protein
LPLHSPDINPLYFYLWGLLKLSVYSSPADDVETPKSNFGMFSNNMQHFSNLGLSMGGSETSNWGLYSSRRWAYGTFTLRSCEELSV